jgi:diguanylate cyclase (GGDEF)-like protein/PAS domain S-box-containing protein
VDSFAGQVAISLRNAQLAQQVQVELRERKQAEDAVRQAEMHFKALIEKATDGIVLVGADGKTKYASPSARKMFDNSADGTGDNPLESIHPEDLSSVLQAMSALIQDPAYTPVIQYRYRNHSNSWLWVESTFSNLLAEPSVQAVVINFRDITIRKQAEDALEKSEAQYRLLAEHMTDTIWLLDMNLKTTYISPSAEKVRGFALEELQDMPAEWNLTPASFKLAMETFAVEIPKVYADPTYFPVVPLELEFQKRDGTICPTESKLSIIRDKNGTPVSILGESRDITERKQAEKALYESERYYRALIENATDCILVVNLDGNIRYESPSVARMLGYAPDALVGTSAFGLINPEDLARIVEPFMEGLKTPGWIHRGEYRLRHANGEERDFEIVSHYMIDDPVIAGIIINGRDITERRLAEDALRESERKFHSVISESADGIALSDEAGRIIEFNHAFEQITGMPREKVMGQFLWDLQFSMIPAKSRTAEQYVRAKQVIQNALESGQSAYLNSIMEVPFEHTNGSIRFLQQRQFSIRTETGWRLGSISRDVTENRRADEALRASEERFRILYEDNPSMYFTTDASGAILSVNKYGAEQLGYAVEELVGRPIFGIFHTDDRAFAQQQFAACLQNLEKAIPIEARKIRKDGTVLWVREAARALHDSGQVIVLLTCDDITERRQAEEALRASEEKSKSLYQMIRLMTDNLPDLVWAKDMDGRFLFVNKATVERLLVAKDTEEPIGRNDLYFANQQRAARPDIPDWHTFGELCVDSDAVIHASRQAQRFEEFGNIKGRFLFLDVYKAPFLNEEGRMIGTVGIGRDVTREKKLEEEYKQAQKALAASEAELRALFASMQDTVLVIDRDGFYRRIAPTNPGKFYLPPAEVIGKHLTNFFSTGEADRFLEIIQRVLGTQQTMQIQYVIDAYGESPWFESTISPMDADSTLWVARDISERKRREDELHRANKLLEDTHSELQRMFAHEQVLARTDGLTNLYNRRHFFELATREFNAALRYQRPLTIVLFDVDGFKQANDTFGHAMGDEILILIAQTASAQVRDVDVLARYGGDEFIILLPQTQVQQALLVAERVREQIAVARVESDHGPFAVTISMGVAEMVHTPQDHSVEDAIRRADQALYAAKAQGNNRTVVYQMK